MTRLVDNPYLLSLVQTRLKELEFTDSKFLKDCAAKGMKIHQPAWSRYINNKDNNKISDEQLFWVCVRLGIDINMRFGKPYITGNEIEWIVPPYNEERCLNKLKQMYSHLTND